MPKGKVVDLHSARTGEYRATLEQIAKKGDCPFCPKNFRFHKGRILTRAGKWYAIHNMHPYPNARVHLLLISERHYERFVQLTPHDFRDISVLVGWAVMRFRIKGGAFLMRFGDTRFTGATVCHLHAHIVVPRQDRKTRRARVVQFPVG